MKKAIEMLLSLLVIPLLLFPFAQVEYFKQNPIINVILIGIAILILIFIGSPKIASMNKQSIYSLESMPQIRSEIRGRDKYYSKINTFIEKKEKSILWVSGESGIGKSAIVASYINKYKKRFDLVIWQPLFDHPTTREVINNWLNLYTETIPDTALTARIDSFHRLAKLNKHRNILIVLDNIESLMCLSNGVVSLPNDFSQLIYRLANINNLNVKIVITSAVSIKGFNSISSMADEITLEKLEDSILKLIIEDRTHQSIDLCELPYANGNPSAALILAGIACENPNVTFGSISNNTFEVLVNTRMNLLSEFQQLLIIFFCIVKYPLTFNEIQNNLKLLPLSMTISKHDIEELKDLFLLDLLNDKYYIANPIVDNVITNKIIMELAAIIANYNIENILFLNKFPLDYTKWPETVRGHTNNHIFPNVVERLGDHYNISKKNIDVNSVLHSCLNYQGFIPSNIVAFLLFIDASFDNIVFPKMDLFGVDFSQVHMFNTDLSKVNINDCDFADRNGSTYAVCFMDNDRLLVGLSSGALELRNTTNLARIKRTEFHSEPLRTIFYSNEFNIIITGGEDGRIIFYDENLEKIKSIDLHKRWIWRIVSLTNNLILTIACDGNIGVVDIKNQTVVRKIILPSQRMWDATVCCEEVFVATEDGILWKCNKKNIIELIEQPIWEIAARVNVPIKTCCNINDTIFLGCRDGKLYKVDVNNTTLISNENSCIRDLVSNIENNIIISVGDDGIAHIYDITTLKPKGEYKVQSSRTWNIAINSIGVAATVGDDRTVHLWSIVDENSLRIASGNGQSLRGVDKYCDFYIFACADDFLRKSSDNCDIIPWQTLRPRKRIMGIVSLKEKFWACTFEDGMIYVGQILEIKKKLKPHEGSIESITRSNDGTLFATGGEDRKIVIYNNEGEQIFVPQQLHSSRIWAISFSPDNNFIASAGGDFMIAVWNITNSCMVSSCVGHSNLVLALAWIDNSTIVSAGTDNTIRLWNANDGSCIKLQPITFIVRGMVSDNKGNVYCVGRKSTNMPGWIVAKWDINNNQLTINNLNVYGGSARTIYYDSSNEKLFCGGDMPEWIEINTVDLTEIKRNKIPGIYSGLKISSAKSVGINSEVLQLLGAKIIDVDSES